MQIWLSVCFFVDDLQVSIVSVAYSQSELLQKEVFLVEFVDSISKSKEPMSHLKAVFFLRPTSENIQHLRRQLASPRFGEYHLCKFFRIWEKLQILFLKSLKIFQWLLEIDLDLILCQIYHSFLQYIEGYANSFFSWFRWTRSCPAGSGNPILTDAVLLSWNFSLHFMFLVFLLSVGYSEKFCSSDIRKSTIVALKKMHILCVCVCFGGGCPVLILLILWCCGDALHLIQSLCTLS